MPPPDLLPLFVFGTLRRGECNHHLLAGHYHRQLSAQLPGFTRIAPLMIAPRPGDVVDGELYFLIPEEYAATLGACDRLEDLRAGTLVGPEYQRDRVRVSTPAGDFDAWAYTSSTVTKT